jgi:alanine transaminase
MGSPCISLFVEKAIAEAERLEVEPDEMYCMKLLEQTGIVVVPGSGFKQEPGTFHFRTTVLPQEEDLEQVVKSIADFNRKFLERYA